mgnify:CR=1 FL=1
MGCFSGTRTLHCWILLAANILNALEYVGVLGVELFVTADALIVNEIAPRVHNSGHWTQNGCIVDQFEQHIRAVVGWPLGDGTRQSDIVMENLDQYKGAKIHRLCSELLHNDRGHPRTKTTVYYHSEEWMLSGDLSPGFLKHSPTPIWFS